MIRAIATLALALLVSEVCAQAPAGAPVRIRGTVVRLDGHVLSVRQNDGQIRTVRLTDDYVVMGIAKASIEDIGTGKFVGTTTVGERDGALVALEVHIFPDNMRGTGEGHYDWDLQPSSKMTNANIAAITKLGANRVLEVQYKGGEKRILVPESAVVVSFRPADRSALTPGAPVFVNSKQQADGSLSAPRVNVGLNGQVPPM